MLHRPSSDKESADKDDGIDTDLITVNNFFTHLIKEISVARYDKQLIPTCSPYKIYQYSDSALKHLPKYSLKKLEKTMLHSKQVVYYNKTMVDSRTHNSTTLNNITDLNINKRIKKFQDQLKKVSKSPFIQ